MCGIVAFKGDKNKTSNVIFDGLKLLEYRGYDSCGIGVIDENEIKTSEVEIQLLLIQLNILLLQS